MVTHITRERHLQRSLTFLRSTSYTSSIAATASTFNQPILMKKNLTPLIALALGLTFSLYADDASIAAKLAKIPKPAAEALKKAAGNAKIEAVDVGKEGKTTVYEVELTEAGKPNREVSVTADGKIIAEEYTVLLDQVPAAAKAAIEAGAKGATIKRVQHITRDGKETYEALYVKKSKETEVEYLADGTLKPE